MNAPLRRPLVGLSLSFVAGTWAGLMLDAPPLALVGLALASLAGAAFLTVLPRKGPSPGAPSLPASLSLHVAVLSLAWLHAALALPRSSLGQPDRPLPPPTDIVQLTGLVQDDPVAVSVRTNYSSWACTLALEGMRSDTNAAWTPARDLVRVQVPVPAWRERPGYGDRWVLTGRFLAPPAAFRPRPSWQPRFRASGQGSRLVSKEHGNRFLAECYRGRTRVAQRLALGIEDQPEAVQIIHSLLLGYRQQMPNATYRTFAATGTVHIFAISGSHVAVMAAIFLFGLTAAGISRIHWILFLAPLLVLFTVSTGMEPSAVRACIMALVYWAAPRFHRRSDLYSSLGFAAILILAVDPTDLLNLGFILSFSAVLGIAVLYPVCIRPFQPLFDPDPLRLQPEPSPVRLGRRIAAGLAGLVATSLAAWIVSTPLTAYYFNLFSLVAIPGNLVALPLAFLVMLTGCLSLLFGAAADWFSVVFNHANAVFVTLLAGCMRVLAAIPGGHWEVPSPSAWWLALFYLLVALLAGKLTVDRKSARLYTIEE